MSHSLEPAGVIREYADFVLVDVPAASADKADKPKSDFKSTSVDSKRQKRAAAM